MAADSASRAFVTRGVKVRSWLGCKPTATAWVVHGSRRASNHEMRLPGGMIPPHDSSGRIHVGFSVDRDQLPAWEECLEAAGVEIIGRVAWPRGGESIYFRDPDDHLLELLTPGVWTIY